MMSREESKALAADTRIVAGEFSHGLDGSDDSEPPSTRAAMHTHTPWQNDYLSPPTTQYPDVRMRVTSRWHGIADFDLSCGSQTLVPGHYGDDRADPDQVILALKAWMIDRWPKRWTVPGARLQTARLAD